MEPEVEQTLERAPTFLRAGGFPARVRAVLAARPWSRRPEPRTRYGSSCLPGLAALGPPAWEAAANELARSEAIRAGRFTYRGRTLVFSGQVDWRPAGVSDAWVQALHRLDDLIPLGVAAAVEPSERATWYGLAMGLVRDWIERARPGAIAWSVPVLACRVANLVQVHSFFAAELRGDAVPRRLLLQSVSAQAEALAAAVASRPPDVWTIVAGRALFLAGRLFDGLEARTWVEAGAQLLWPQLREQVHEDGGHRDRNPGVQALALAQYLHVCAVLQASHDDLPVWGRKRVKGMADFLARIVHPDGSLPRFHGGALDGVPPARELLATAAIVLHEPELARGGELPGAWPLLLVGESGRRTWRGFGGTTAAVPVARALRRTCYYVLAGEAGDAMILDGDAPGPGGAANVFGYELSVGGERLVVTGGAEPEAAGAWAAFSRGARSHNTLALATGDAEVAGEVIDAHWTVKHGLVCFSGTRQGLLPQGADLRHRRRVLCLPGRFWIVCDELLGAGVATAESYVHLHPETTVAAVCQGRPAFHVARSAQAMAQIVFAGGARVEMAGGIPEPRPQGWVSDGVGVRTPAPTIVLGMGGRLPLVLAYAILPRTGAPAALAVGHDGLDLRARLTIGGATWEIAAGDDDLELRAAPGAA